VQTINKCDNDLTVQHRIIITGRPARSAAMPVLFLLSGPKMGFSPRRGDTLPDKREIWHGEADRRFHVYRGRNVGIQTQNSKFLILALNLPLGGHLFPNFYEILRFCTRLQMDIKFLLWLLSGYKQISYKHFPAVGAFYLKFPIAPSGQTTDRIKKVREVQKRDGPPLYHAKYGGDRGSRAGCRRKSVMFLFFFVLFFCLF